MAMPHCCYLAKGAKRPSHTTNTIKFDRTPFDPCNSIERFDFCPFDHKHSTYLQPPTSHTQLLMPHIDLPVCAIQSTTLDTAHFLLTDRYLSRCYIYPMLNHFYHQLQLQIHKPSLIITNQSQFSSSFLPNLF